MRCAMHSFKRTFDLSHLCQASAARVPFESVTLRRCNKQNKIWLQSSRKKWLLCAPDILVDLEGNYV